MANIRLNIWENIPLVNVLSTSGGATFLFMQGVYIPGSISFNNVACLLECNAGQANGSHSILFGLYSLNGGTLSLANSASVTLSNSNVGFTSFLTMVTSATQDITPGNWYLARNYIASVAFISFYQIGGNFAWTNPYGGKFVRGRYSASTNAMPASIATSDMIKEGTAGNTTAGLVSYILISA